MKYTDKTSPEQLLEKRKKEIDRYISRMDKVGSRGDFYDYYVGLSNQFGETIKVISKAPAMYELLKQMKEAVEQTVDDSIVRCKQLGLDPEKYSATIKANQALEAYNKLFEE